MKPLFIFLLCITPFLIKAQTKQGNILIKIDSLKDTLTIGAKNDFCKIELVNGTNLPIRLSDYYFRYSYYKVIYFNNDTVDTLVKSNFSDHADIDPFSPEKWFTVEPYRSKEFKFNFGEGFIRKIGDYKIKFILQLSRMDKALQDIESDWMHVYVKSLLE